MGLGFRVKLVDALRGVGLVGFSGNRNRSASLGAWAFVRFRPQGSKALGLWGLGFRGLGVLRFQHKRGLCKADYGLAPMV